MIEDLIEGIACYCDTEDQYNALQNLTNAFSDNYHLWRSGKLKLTGNNLKLAKDVNDIRDNKARMLRYAKNKIREDNANRSIIGKFIHRNDLNRLQVIGGITRRHKGQGMDEYTMAKIHSKFTGVDSSVMSNIMKKSPTDIMYKLLKY
jgi:hypothetical protein